MTRIGRIGGAPSAGDPSVAVPMGTGELGLPLVVGAFVQTASSVTHVGKKLLCEVRLEHGGREQHVQLLWGRPN